MDLVVVAFAAVLGLLIGSFLNVVIYRVPAGESVVSPRSRCPRCGTELAARDNIPVLSWVFLRGRCRTCAEPISSRYPLVEAGCGVLFALMTWRFLDSPLAIPAYLYLAAVGLALAMIDIDTKRLPDALTLPSYPVAAALLLIPAIGYHEWSSFVRAVLGAAALGGFYFVVLVIYPKGMGWGDVRLAGVLGAYLGWLSWGHVAAGGFLGFALGGVLGGLLMLLGRAGRKTAIPFGPFMILGTIIAVLWGQGIVDWYAGILGQ